MHSLHKLLLTTLVSILACISVDAANAEIASVYGGPDGLCGTRTANGERLDCSDMTAAHRTLPFGSRVTVCHHGCVVVRINDRGPFVPGCRPRVHEFDPLVGSSCISIDCRCHGT